MYNKNQSLDKKRGTIAWWLTKNQDKIFSAGNDFGKMKAIVLQLLEAPEVADNPATAEAKRIFAPLTGSRFSGTLVTYMTGLKVN